MAEHAKHDLIWARNNAASGEDKPVVQMTWAKFQILSKGENSPWEEVSEPSTGEADQSAETVPATTPAPTPARTARPAVTQEKENA